jgi:hypothetical protein
MLVVHEKYLTPDLPKSSANFEIAPKSVGDNVGEIQGRNIKLFYFNELLLWFDTSPATIFCQIMQTWPTSKQARRDFRKWPAPEFGKGWRRGE